MSDETFALAQRWAEQTQAITLEQAFWVDPVNWVMRGGALARQAAEELPFEAEPAGFARALSALAGENNHDV